MPRDDAGPTREDYLIGRAPVLLRLAHQLTGDADAAVETVSAAAVRLPRHGPMPDLDRVAIAAVVRQARARARRRPGASVDAPALQLLPPGQRAAVVLAFGLGWDAEAIAETRRSSPQRVRRNVAQALTDRSETAWRSLLDDPRWTISVPDDLVARTRRAARRRRDRHAVVGLAASCAAMIVASSAVAIVRVVTEPPPPPPTAHEAGLLAWPARGGLIRDRTFIGAAIQRWRGSPTPPGGDVFVLFAGRVGVGRLAVLQSRPDDPAATGGVIAIVGDHDISYRHPRLELQAVRPLGDPAAAALVIPYDGNLGLPGLATGPGSQLDQLLVAPDVDRVDVRAVRTVTSTRPGFASVRISEGVTEPWLDLAANPSTAVRIHRRDASTVTALLQLGEVLPFALKPAVLDPPSSWSGLPRPADPAPLADDAIWWTQRCRSPAAQVELVWMTRAPAFPAPVRFEFVTCPGQLTVARFLTGIGAGTRVLGESNHVSDAYGVDLVPDNGGHASVAIVGSRRVAVIRYAGQVVHERTAVIPLAQAVGLAVLAVDGSPVALH